MLLFIQAVAANANATDPLAELRDITLPAAVGYWPLAAGWWCLLALVLLLLLALPLLLWFRHRRRYWRWAKAEWQQCQQLVNADDPRLLLQRLSALLRRVVLLRANNEQATSTANLAQLQGDDWQGYLTQGRAGLSAQHAYWLAHALYLPADALAEQAIDKPALLAAVRRWLQENSR